MKTVVRKIIIGLLWCATAGPLPAQNADPATNPAPAVPGTPVAPAVNSPSAPAATTPAGPVAEPPPTTLPAFPVLDPSNPSPDPAGRATNVVPTINRRLPASIRGRTNASMNASAPGTTNRTAPAFLSPGLPAGPTAAGPNPPLGPRPPGGGQGNLLPPPGMGNPPFNQPGGIPPGPMGPPLAAGGDNAAGAPTELSFKNTPVEQVLEFYASLVDKTIIRHPQIQPTTTITIKNQTTLSKEETRQALDAILSYNNITLVPLGEKFLAAVPAANALMEAVPFKTSNPQELPEATQFVTEVVRLTNVMPSAVQSLIQPFAKMPAGIVAIDDSQILILRDYAVNVKRMLEILKKVDVNIESDYKLEVIPIRYGKVTEMYNVMGQLTGGGGGGGTPNTPGSTRTTSRTGARAGGSSSMRGNSSSSRLGQNRNQLGQQQGLPGQQPTATGAQSDFNRRIQQIVSKAATGDSQLLGDAKIIPDERSNSLVVYANKQDMQVITNIVAKLDVMLAQVLIEAVILRVTLGDNVNYGVSYFQKNMKATSFDNVSSGFGGVNNGLSEITSNLTSAAIGAASGFSYYAKIADDLDIAVSAIAGNNKTIVLQRPKIQTTHAVPATFTSGNSYPYAGGSSYGGTSYYGQTLTEYINTAITLTVTPYITPDGLVMMEIEQTIDGFEGYVTIASGSQSQQAPQTSTRSAASTVAVQDGETIILGGFIESTKSAAYSGIPLLKDIPVLGALFRSNKKDNTRNELLILLRPKILPTPLEAAKEVQNQRKQFPGVRMAEKEFDTEEKKIQKDTDKKIKKIK